MPIKLFCDRTPVNQVIKYKHMLCVNRYDPEQFAGTSIPISVIGTKMDLAQAAPEVACRRSSNIAEECAADEINLVSVKHNILDVTYYYCFPK